jgi:hypothetical protein
MTDSSTEGADLTADTTNQVVDAGSTSAPVVNADPTPAKEPSSVLDAVTKALSSDKGVDAAPPAAVNRSPEGDPDPNKTSSEGEPAEISDEEMKHLAPKTQERMRFLASQRTELQTQLDVVKPKAEANDRLTGFLSQNNISSDEANNALELTRLIKAGDYVNAKKLLDPVYAELQRRAGDVLDPDLAEEVRLGQISHERALELQRTKAANVSRQTQEQVAEERRKTAEQSEQWKSHVGTVATAADSWAKDQAKSDPDWALKAEDVATLVELDLRKNGFPKTAAEAIERSKTALETVNKRLARVRPAPVEIKPNIGNGSRSSPSSTAKPKSALDAINIAFGE